MTDFIDFARAHGVDIREPHPGGRIRRCSTIAHPRSKNGAYWFDGTRGWVQNWEHGDSVKWWHGPGAAIAPSAADRTAWAVARRAAEAQRQLGQQSAADRAGALLASAVPGAHGYLGAKGFGDTKALVLADGTLFIPMRDAATNALLGAQLIRLDENRWTKKMLPGMRAKGAVFVIGNRRAAERWLVEGYATGLSVARALGQLRLDASVVVCFSAHNLVHVADSIGGHRYVFADNDASGAGQRAAIATGLPWVMSPTLGEDANDLYRREGVLSLCAQLMTARASRKNRPDHGRERPQYRHRD